MVSPSVKLGLRCWVSRRCAELRAAAVLLGHIGCSERDAALTALADPDSGETARAPFPCSSGGPADMDTTPTATWELRGHATIPTDHQVQLVPDRGDSAGLTFDVRSTFRLAEGWRVQFDLTTAGDGGDGFVWLWMDTDSLRAINYHFDIPTQPGSLGYALPDGDALVTASAVEFIPMDGASRIRLLRWGKPRQVAAEVEGPPLRDRTTQVTLRSEDGWTTLELDGVEVAGVADLTPGGAAGHPALAASNAATAQQVVVSGVEVLACPEQEIER
jgi:hypothetical protein